MTPLETIRIWGLEKLGRYYSSYRAFVLDPNPDDKNIGNVLVHIPRVQGGMKIVARAKQFYGGPGFGIKYFQPHKGEIVWVEFENGNPTKPVWSYHTWGEGECPNELKDINTCGLVTANGNKVFIKESEDGTVISVSINDGPSIELSNDQVKLVNKDSTVTMSSDSIKINNGNNGGLINIETLRSLITAIQNDLTLVGSGGNLARWQISEALQLEDKKITH